MIRLTIAPTNPAGAPVATLARSASHAAAILRTIARRRGVSPLALDWSAAAVRRPA